MGFDFGKKIHRNVYYAGYLIYTLTLELSISIFLLLIGMNFFPNVFWYNILISAFLGGLWSYRVNYTYKVMREVLEKEKNEIKIYFDESIWEAFGHQQRIHIFFSFALLDLFLMIYLYL